MYKNRTTLNYSPLPGPTFSLVCEAAKVVLGHECQYCSVSCNKNIAKIVNQIRHQLSTVHFFGIYKEINQNCYYHKLCITNNSRSQSELVVVTISIS